jgi:hypothetical protein
MDSIQYPEETSQDIEARQRGERGDESGQRGEREEREGTGPFFVSGVDSRVVGSYFWSLWVERRVLMEQSPYWSVDRFLWRLLADEYYLSLRWGLPLLSCWSLAVWWVHWSSLKGCDVILAVKERAEGRLRQRYESEPLELSEDEGERMFSAGDPCSSSGGLTERERRWWAESQEGY